LDLQGYARSSLHVQWASFHVIGLHNLTSWSYLPLKYTPTPTRSSTIPTKISDAENAGMPDTVAPSNPISERDVMLVDTEPISIIKTPRRIKK